MEESQSVDIKALKLVEVIGEDFNRYPLKRFWESKPAIIVFIRHFACPSCAAHVHQVWSNREHYEKKGAQIYFIGNGTPEMIDEFKKQQNVQDAWIYTDPTLESYAACGFSKRKMATFNLGTVRNLMKMRAAGIVAKSSWTPQHGDRWQLGGVVAIKPGDQVTFKFVSKVVGDTPEDQKVAEQSV